MGDGALLARAEPLTFEQVFEACSPFTWRALLHLGVPRADVDDLCQEVFVVVHRKLPTFEGRSTLRTWIYGICTRVAHDYRKKAHVRRERVFATPRDPAEADSADSHASAEQRQLLERLLSCLDRLDDAKRAVFVLYEIEELTIAEVAEAVGCPLQTAYSRLNAARKVVRQEFTNTGGAR